MTERGINPGVCGYCGYRIRPELESFVSVGAWDFAHERCKDD